MILIIRNRNIEHSIKLIYFPLNTGSLFSLSAFIDSLKSYFPLAMVVFSGLCIIFFHFFCSGGLATMTYDECQNYCLNLGL